MIPLSNKTFTVKRKSVVNDASGNPIPGGPQTITTGVPVHLKDLNGLLLNQQSGQIVTGLFRGTAAKNAPIVSGDTLYDETENDAKGNPLQYRVEQSTMGPFHLKLHLKRLTVGV